MSGRTSSANQGHCPISAAGARLAALQKECTIHSENIVRRSSSVVDGFKNMQDSITGQIDKIVEKQQIYFRSLTDEELDAAIEAKYKECNTGKRGKMTMKEFGCAMSVMGKEFSEDDVQACFQVVDTDANKIISPEEFNFWFREFVGAQRKAPIPDPDMPAETTTRRSSRSSRRLSRVAAANFAAASMRPPSRVTRSGRRSSLPLQESSEAQSTLSDRGRRFSRVRTLDDSKTPQSPSSDSSRRFSRVRTLDDSGSTTPQSSSSLDGKEVLRTGSNAKTRGSSSERRGSTTNSSMSAEARAKEVLQELEKRRNLSSIYGRLPGWAARASRSGQGTPPKSSSKSGEDFLSANTIVSTDSNANTGSGACTVQVDTTALGPTGMDPVESPADVTEGATRAHWSSSFGSMLSNTFKMKRDSLRNVNQPEHAKSPLLRLAETVTSVKLLLSTLKKANLLHYHHHHPHHHHDQSSSSSS